MKHIPHGLLAVAALVCLSSPAKGAPEKGETKPDPNGEPFEKKCTHCHDLTLVEEAHRTRTNAEMKKILIRHKDKPGSEITTKELKAFLRLY